MFIFELASSRKQIEQMQSLFCVCILFSVNNKVPSGLFAYFKHFQLWKILTPSCCFDERWRSRFPSSYIRPPVSCCLCMFTYCLPGLGFHTVQLESLLRHGVKNWRWSSFVDQRRTGCYWGWRSSQQDGESVIHLTIMREISSSADQKTRCYVRGMGRRI